MNEFAAAGIIAMLAATCGWRPRPRPVGVFVVGALVLLGNVYLSSWLTDFLWRRRGWIDAVAEDDGWIDDAEGTQDERKERTDERD